MTRSQTAAPRIATRLALLLLAGLPLTGCSIIPDPKDAPTIYAPEAKAKADPALRAQSAPEALPTQAETQAAMKDFSLPPELQQMLNQQNKGPR